MVDQIPVPVPMSAIREFGGRGMEGWRWDLLFVERRKRLCWRFRRTEARV